MLIENDAAHEYCDNEWHSKKVIKDEVDKRRLIHSFYWYSKKIVVNFFETQPIIVDILELLMITHIIDFNVNKKGH